MNTEYYLIDPKQMPHPNAKMVRRDVVMLNQGEMIQALRTATMTINSLLSKIQADLQPFDQTGSILRNGMRGDIDYFKRYGNLHIYENDQFNERNLDYMTQLQVILWQFRNDNETAMAQIVEGRSLASGKLYFNEHQLQAVIRPHPFDRTNGRPRTTLFELALVAGYVCTSCGNPIAEEDRRYHVAHPGCGIKVAAKEAARASLEKATFDVGLAAREAGINTRLIPVKHDIWVETWVMEAVRLYQNNPDGYAGLSLAEFLAKSKPERAASAVQEETP